MQNQAESQSQQMNDEYLWVCVRVIVVSSYYYDFNGLGPECCMDNNPVPSNAGP